MIAAYWNSLPAKNPAIIVDQPGITIDRIKMIRPLLGRLISQTFE